MDLNKVDELIVEMKEKAKVSKIKYELAVKDLKEAVQQYKDGQLNLEHKRICINFTLYDLKEYRKNELLLKGLKALRVQELAKDIAKELGSKQEKAYDMNIDKKPIFDDTQKKIELSVQDYLDMIFNELEENWELIADKNISSTPFSDRVTKKVYSKNDVVYEVQIYNRIPFSIKLLDEDRKDDKINTFMTDTYKFMENRYNNYDKCLLSNGVVRTIFNDPDKWTYIAISNKNIIKLIRKLSL